MSNTQVPEIPQIKGDNQELLLDLFTHDTLMQGSAMNSDYGDIHRLRCMGESVLHLVVYNHLFSMRPQQDLNQIEVIPPLSQSVTFTHQLARLKVQASELIGHQKADLWITSYGLKSRVRVLPNDREAYMQDAVVSNHNASCFE